ncbi:hypothetical protein [Maricaulis salignorans]|nr:hypothetical protein [Maricaulis salignorans]
MIFGTKFPDFCINGLEKFRPEGIFLTAPEQGLTGEQAIAARVFHDELVSLSDSDLDARWNAALAEEQAKREAAHPLNQHVADAATYDFYSKAAYWTVDECCALLVARHPRKVDLKAIQSHGRTSQIARQFLDLHDLVTRAVSMNQLAHRNLPGFFLAWADRNRLPIPDGLASAVQNHGVQVADWKTYYDKRGEVIAGLQARISQLENGSPPEAVDPMAKPLDPRERASLLKMVLGLAMAIYGHDPRQTRMKSVSEIKSELDRVGITMSDDTIRRYLREANEYAPDGYPESE